MTAKLNQTIKYVFLTTDAIISAASEMCHTIDIMKTECFQGCTFNTSTSIYGSQRLYTWTVNIHFNSRPIRCLDAFNWTSAVNYYKWSYNSIIMHNVYIKHAFWGAARHINGVFHWLAVNRLDYLWDGNMDILFVIMW